MENQDMACEGRELLPSCFSFQRRNRRLGVTTVIPSQLFLSWQQRPVLLYCRAPWPQPKRAAGCCQPGGCCRKPGAEESAGVIWTSFYLFFFFFFSPQNCSTWGFRKRETFLGKCRKKFGKARLFSLVKIGPFYTEVSVCSWRTRGWSTFELQSAQVVRVLWHR